MTEIEVEIRTSDGLADGLLYQPETDSPSPGVFFLTDIGGIRASQRAMAARLCSEGYSVLLPNIFYRSGKPPLFEPGVKFGDEKFMKRMGELSSALPPEAVERDAASYIDFFARHEGVKGGPFGAVGLCFAGAVVMRMAAARPDQVAAGASFHGGRLYLDGPNSPHLLLPKIKARLDFGHATRDNSMPQEAIEKFNAALKAWGGKYDSDIYEGALHGWTVCDSPVFNPPQAERAFSKLKELFRTAL